MTHIKAKIACTIGLIALVALVASCNLFVGPQPKSGSTSTSATTGQIKISVPLISSHVLEAAEKLAATKGSVASASASGARSASRAMLVANRVEFELLDSGGATVAQWTAENKFGSFGGDNSTTATVPVGSGYTLKARVYNNLVSTSESVVSGEVGEITVSASATTSVLIPCIPNPGFVTDLSLGVGATGSLQPLVTPQGGGMPTSFDAGERWYRLSIPAGVEWIKIAPSVSTDGAETAVLLFRSDGHYCGLAYAVIVDGGSTISPLGFKVDPLSDYYLGVLTVNMINDDPVSYGFGCSSITPIEGIMNGDFVSGMANWDLVLRNGGEAVFNVVGGEAKIDIANGGQYEESVALQQSSILLEQGVSYRLSLKARTSGGTWNGYFDFSQADLHIDYECMSLTPVMTQMDYYFTYPGTSTLDNLKIYFGDSGATGYSVYFDDIALERAPNPLAAPANLQANVNGTSVALSWDAVPGATRYSVECSSAASHSVSVSTQQASTSYTDNGCDSNTTYTYIVYALTDNAISPASEVTVTTGQGPALTGTLSGLPLADGTWQALLKDGNWRTHKTTLTVSGGSAAFTVYAGVPNLSPDNLVMWLDSDGDGGETIETGDIVARVDAGYTWDQATGTASGLNFTNWETMGNATAIVIAIQQDSNIELNWMEPRCTGSILRRVQQSTDAANWADISAGSGGDMDSYWCNFSFGGTESGTYYWRVGVDANGNGSVDADEYGLPSAPLSIIVPPGTVGITVQ